MTINFLPLETSNFPLLIGLLFVAGIVGDILDTWVTFTIVKRQTLTTAIITFVGIVLDFTVFLSFISNLDKWYVILSYALGATVGTTYVIEMQKRSTRKKKRLEKLRKLKGARRKRIMMKRHKSLGNKKGPKKFGRFTFWQAGSGKSKPNVMKNEDRRRMGLEQDPDLEDYQPNERPKEN